MTGAVASERVSEALKGFPQEWLETIQSVKAKGSLTATPTGGAGTKMRLSDPVVISGICHRSTDKSYYLGITGLSLPEFHRREVWHLDVGSSHPGAEAGPKGWAVRPLKRYAELGSERRETVRSYPAQAEEI